MTTYYAAVKYALDDPPDRKIASLRDGLSDIAMALIEEHGCDLGDVQEWLENAAGAAEWSWAEVSAR
jgi:hypothetical protein